MTACDATWRCWCCQMCSNAPGGAERRSLAGRDPTCARARSGLLLHGRGLLGPRMDHAAARVDYAYDKRLYDRLRDAHARPVREHFHAGLDYQGKLGASWRIMTSRGRPPPSRRGCTRRLRSSPTCRPGCGSSTRVSSRVAGSDFAAPRPRAARTNRRRAAAVLRPPARRAQPSDRSRR